MRPEVGEVTEQVYAALTPYTNEDEAQDWALLKFVDAICEVYFEAIDELVSDRDYPGWYILFDPDLCPAEYLPYLAQYVGVTLEPSLTEQEQRDKIKLPENFKRGTPAALRRAIERTLTGNKTILLDERHDDEAYQLRIRTFATETPSESATLAAILTQKPAGLALTYDAIEGQSWDDLVADHADWNAVLADYATWTEARTELP